MQIECQHQLIEQLAMLKTEEGFYSDFELNFNLPTSTRGQKLITSICNVSYCRRLRQDSYHLGLSFVNLDESAERLLDKYIAQAEPV